MKLWVGEGSERVNGEDMEGSKSISQLIMVM